MYTTVGRLSSYISQGVYTVSGPFHPFGGAVDIIVVEQQDGTFKSTPWYVKFGKFQGVLKGTEKIVTIAVDDAQASFHMYLDHKGEAYFLEDEKNPYGGGDEALAIEYNKEEEASNDKQDSEGKEETSEDEEDDIEAPLMPLVANSTLMSIERVAESDTSSILQVYEKTEALEAPPETTSKVNDDSVLVESVTTEVIEDSYLVKAEKADNGPQEEQVEEPEMQQDKQCEEAECPRSPSGREDAREAASVSCEDSVVEKRSWGWWGWRGRRVPSTLSSRAPCEQDDPSALSYVSVAFEVDESEAVVCKLQLRKNCKCAQPVTYLNGAGKADADDEVFKSCLALPELLSTTSEEEDDACSANRELTEEADTGDSSTAATTMRKMEKGRGDILDIAPKAASALANGSSGGWKLWPFVLRRPKLEPSGDAVLVATQAAVHHSALASGLIQGGNGYYRRSWRVRTLIPSSTQLASLNLKKGRNKITFTFTTRMLGKQQVDARIYLWKWDAKIVISDVDGTITKSDVLGQVMPLVGRDWTQTGVTRLFSAIKDNGYELMFLSARAISQAYLTRQFLVNLKQDGEALPDGPVVISPDGLFPSLYREVIRRAPHEFKIACLEDIKALFPSESQPFYAGFGNRDTDELSYLKVGIPKGKIFIINPKGEVIVNNFLDLKSYTSLHKLVNDMFPPVNLAEREDFNSWNFWKVPLPEVDGM